MIGTKLKNGEYTIEKDLGTGGEGAVYLARNRVGKRFAIKMLNSRDLAGQKDRERFESQARKLVELSQHSEYLVEVIDYFVERWGPLDVPCMVMEYLAGGSLADQLREHPSGLPVADVRRWMVDVTEGLEELHKANILHRDLKPANILLRRKGKRELAVLTDFGLMADLDETSSGNKGASAGYFAPEQWSLKTKEQDGRLDLYALGMTMYRLLTGKWPYSFDSAENYYAQLGRVRPVSPSHYRPELRDGSSLDELILELIAVDRSRRPRDACVVRKRLEWRDSDTVPRRKRVSPKDGLTYVWIPAGRFRMGCSEADGECEVDEKPAREVVIAKGFWLAETPITQEAYEMVMGNNPSCCRGAKRPVENVSWHEAREYCRTIGGRLPKEAEWEYAARAGTVGARYGPVSQIAWHAGNSGGQSQNVKAKWANAFGLYDMLGNVWEWTEDWYDQEFYERRNGVDGPPAGTAKVIRGGSWNFNPLFARVSYRYVWRPEGRQRACGFRCAIDSL